MEGNNSNKKANIYKKRIRKTEERMQRKRMIWLKQLDKERKGEKEKNSKG